MKSVLNFANGNLLLSWFMPHTLVHVPASVLTTHVS